MSRLCYITRNYKSTRYGGGKARVDIEDILVDMGAVNLGLRRTFCRNMVTDYFRNLAGIIHFMFCVRKGDTLVLQYPLKKYFRFVCLWARLRGVRTISLVHDLGCFRRHRLTVEQEIKKFSLSDALIVANDRTAEWLRQKGYKNPMTEQVAWDFLSDATPEGRETSPMSCLFVGGLKPESNGFLYKLPQKVEVDLYGQNAPAEVPNNVHVHGFGLPDEIIKDAPGHFGLIWYGITLGHDDKGYIGEYIKLCNSHKMGLYMRAGKPVIIWKGAGAAPFVQREGVGLTVDTLENLDEILENVTHEQYNAMIRNVRRVAQKMAHGGYFRDALNRLLLKV